MNIDQVIGGSTPKWGLTIRDEAGNIIDPSDSNKVDKVHIEIFNEETKDILIKFAYPAEEEWETAVVENNEQVTFVIPTTITDGAEKNKEFGVVAEVHLKVDAGLGYPNDIDIVIKRGTLVKFIDKESKDPVT